MRPAPLVALAAALLSGCAKGEGTVVLTVGAMPPLAGVVKLHGSATVGHTTRAFDVALRGAPAAIPPARTVAIVVPLALGDRLAVHVEAQDGAGALLAAADGTVGVSAGKRSDLTLVLGARPDDMGVSVDGGDMASGGSDGGGGDLCPPGGCKLANGAACSDDGSSCASGHCVDGFCCGASACAPCQACNGSGGTCAAQPAGPGNGCGGGMACDGNGNCVTLGSPGAPCMKPSDCGNNQCVDGHCCGVTTCGSCKACTGAGGTCAAQAAGDGSGCTAAMGKYCDGSGNCTSLVPLGNPCQHNYECNGGRCVDGHCCSVASCGVCKACTGASGTCVSQPAGQPGNGCPDGAGDSLCDGAGHCKRGIAQACASAGDCFNGLCYDNVCCNMACGGQCQACNQTPGSCLPVTGKPVLGTNTARMDCTGAMTSCYGACSGNSMQQTACVYPGPTTPCGTNSCVAGSGNTPAHVVAQFCDNNGGCTNQQSSNCGTISGTIVTIKCSSDGSACQANCASDSDCVTGTYCSTANAPNGMPGSCVPQLTDGSFCGPPLITADCMSIIGCNPCQSTCQANGQCCGVACAAPKCKTTLSTTMPVCNGMTCSNNSETCGGGCDTNTGLCGCNPSTHTCQVGYYCDTAMHCVPLISSGGTCKSSDCLQNGCSQCVGNVPCPASGLCP